jgi:hypothetical protein
MTPREKQEKKRLAALKQEAKDHPSVNTAKRYKLPKAAVEIIAKAGNIHGQQSRAIQVATELLWHAIGYGVTDQDMKTVLDSPRVGKTYKLPERTIGLIHGLSLEYGTLGKAMAAVAVVLSKPDPRKALTKMPAPPKVEIDYEGKRPQDLFKRDLERAAKRTRKQ